MLWTCTLETWKRSKSSKSDGWELLSLYPREGLIPCAHLAITWRHIGYAGKLTQSLTKYQFVSSNCLCPFRDQQTKMICTVTHLRLRLNKELSCPKCAYVVSCSTAHISLKRGARAFYLLWGTQLEMSVILNPNWQGNKNSNRLTSHLLASYMAHVGRRCWMFTAERWFVILRVSL